MKRILYLTLLLTLSASAAVSQNINFVMPNAVNKYYSFAVHTGLRMDTIARGIVNPMGMGHFAVPLKYKNVPAMGLLSVEGQEPISLIVNNENFSFQQSKDGKLAFNGSHENDLFYNKQKEVMNGKNDSTYVYAYQKTMAAIVKMANVLNKQDKATLFEKTSARLGILTDVDIDKLYYNRFWYYAIDGLMRMSIGQEGFANDMMRLLDKTKTEKVHLKLVEDLITITNQYGLDDAFDIIMPHVEASNRIEYPQGTVYDAFAMAKVRKGIIAPKILGLTKELGATNHKYTFIMFHQPGCESCADQLNELEAQYKYFVDNKIRIITISGALEQEAFVGEAQSFQWQDKLCDYKGFAGPNFREYGIIGTPTLYLLDSKNEVLGRFSKILEITKHISSVL